jgi:hypothetical protein
LGKINVFSGDSSVEKFIKGDKMKKTIPLGLTGIAVALAALYLTSAALAEDFGSITSSSGEYSADNGSATAAASSSPSVWQQADTAMQKTADNNAVQSGDEGQTKLHVMSAEPKSLVDPTGQLNPSLKSGETGYYNNFPVVYNYEAGKGHTFSVQFSINGYQTGDGTQPFTKNFTCQRTGQLYNTLNNVKDFINTRTDPSKAIEPSLKQPTPGSTGEIDWEVWDYAGFKYVLYTGGFAAETKVYYRQNGVENTKTFQMENYVNIPWNADPVDAAEGAAQNFILNNALIKPPISAG